MSVGVSIYGSEVSTFILHFGLCLVQSRFVTTFPMVQSKIIQSGNQIFAWHERAFACIACDFPREYSPLARKCTQNWAQNADLSVWCTGANAKAYTLGFPILLRVKAVLYVRTHLTGSLSIVLSCQISTTRSYYSTFQNDRPALKKYTYRRTSNSSNSGSPPAYP